MSPLALAPYGWALSSGDYGGVGVGGLATAGGVGWLVREHGLTIDHLRTAQIVLADGAIVDASEKENADLFWAIRGAGANMGIVTAFEFEVDPIGNVGWAQLVLDATDIAEFLQIWGNWIETAPRDTTSFMIIGQQRGAPAGLRPCAGRHRFARSRHGRQPPATAGRRSADCCSSASPSRPMPKSWPMPATTITRVRAIRQSAPVC